MPKRILFGGINYKEERSSFLKKAMKQNLISSQYSMQYDVNRTRISSGFMDAALISGSGKFILSVSPV